MSSSPTFLRRRRMGPGNLKRSFTATVSSGRRERLQTQSARTSEARIDPMSRKGGACAYIRSINACSGVIARRAFGLVRHEPYENPVSLGRRLTMSQADRFGRLYPDRSV